MDPIESRLAESWWGSYEELIQHLATEQIKAEFGPGTSKIPPSPTN